MELADLTEAIQAKLATLDRDAMVDTAELREILALRERTDALALAATAAWDRTERWRADGHLTADAALRANGVRRGDASRLVGSARLLARNERLAKTLAAGDLTADHVGVMARHATPPRAELFDDHADTIIDTAVTLNADHTNAMMRRWASHADDALNRGEPDDIDNRRGFWANQVGHATEARVVGHADEMAALLAALDRMQPPDPKHTPGGARSLAQRRYDALMQLAGLGLQDSDGRIDPTHTVNIVIDAATLAGEFNPNGRSDIPGLGSVLPSRVQQLLCGSWISRVIMDPNGQPLDLGRRARLFSPAQQQAIIVRDGGCAIEGCDRPPHWCDAHHLDPWAPPTEGDTNLDNGLGLCRGHHTLVHNGWSPTQNPDGTWHLQPP
jgi:hypothetical protein